MKTTDRYNMRKSLFLIKAFVVVMIMAGFNQSCTNLDEELFDSVTPDNFFNTEEEILAALGAAYTQFGNLASGEPFFLQNVSTDEMAVPTRGQDWDDGGEWRRLSLHSWTREDGYFNGGWNFGFNGVNTANRLIFQFQLLVDDGAMDPTLAAAFIAELRVVRGYFYWQLIDLFGNVPLVTDFENTEATPPTVSRAEVFAWVVADLEEAVPLLSKVVDGTTYGRINYYGGKALLAKLYLNAEVYTGTPMLTQAGAACDDIINDGLFSLEGDYFANFSAGNTGTAEMIFALPYDQVYYGGFNLTARTLHYGSQQTYNLSAQPWNGFCTLEEFYNSYDDTDLRKGDAGTITGPATRRGNFIAGYQWKASGGLVTDDGFESPNPARLPVPLLGDPDGAPLNFGNIGSSQPTLNELGPQAYRQSGVRIGKWEFAMGGDPGAMDNDYAVFRYADVLLMKAEVLFRGGTAALALPLVNTVRQRAGLTDLASLDGPVSFDMAGPSVAGGELYNEIGREMFAESSKRQALIRWGMFTRVADWLPPFYNTQDVLVDGAHTTLYPVHREKIDANPNLVQNPGYN
jgi:hypothetical protein